MGCTVKGYGGTYPFPGTCAKAPWKGVQENENGNGIQGQRRGYKCATNLAFALPPAHHCPFQSQDSCSPGASWFISNPSLYFCPQSLGIEQTDAELSLGKTARLSLPEKTFQITLIGTSVCSLKFRINWKLRNQTEMAKRYSFLVCSG